MGECGGFSSFPTILQSYQDNSRVNIMGSVFGLGRGEVGGGNLTRRGTIGNMCVTILVQPE